MQENKHYLDNLDKDEVERFFSETDKNIKETTLRIKAKRESLDKSMQLGSRITSHRFTL